MRSNTACLDNLVSCLGDCGALKGEQSIWFWCPIRCPAYERRIKFSALLFSCSFCKFEGGFAVLWFKERVPCGWIEMASPAIWSVSSCVSWSGARCDLTVSKSEILGVVNINAITWRLLTVLVCCLRYTDYFGCASDVSLSLRYSNVLSWGHSVDWFRIDCLFGDSHCSSGDCVLSFLCWDWFFRNSNSYWAA